MRIGSLMIGLALVLTFGLAPNDAVAQDAPAVNNVLFIDTGGDLPKFLEFFTRATAIGEKYGTTGKGRLWFASLAGPNTGSVIVVNEYPNLVSMAESQTKVGQSPEWQQFIADFEAAGMSVTSSGVSVEITP